MARGKKKTNVLTAIGKTAVALVPEEECPYQVPKNWCWLRGSSIFLPMETKRPIGEYFKYIDIDSINNKRQIIDEPKILLVKDAPSRASRKLHVGDTLFSLVRPYLKNIAYVDEQVSDAIASTGFYVCSPRRIVNPQFNYYMMVSSYVVDGLNTYMKGDNSPSIRKDHIEKYAYPIPPLPEQQRIVARIESLFSKLDEAKEKAQIVVDGFEDRKAAILHKAFTGELTEQWRKKNGYRLEQWTRMKLKDCGEWMGGGTPSMAHPEYWENGDILWVTSKDMKSDIIEDTLMRTNMVGVSNSSAKYSNKPSVLFVMRSGILRRTLPIAMVKIPFTVNQDLKAVAPDQIDIDYLFWVCESNEKTILNTCMKSGTTVESVNATALMEFVVPIAPRVEQGIIVKTIVHLLQKEQQAKEAAEQVIAQIDTMKKSILARAFRGELGTNDPNDESAVELLKRVL